jgi:hypothetical protein
MGHSSRIVASKARIRSSLALRAFLSVMLALQPRSETPDPSPLNALSASD